MQASEMNKLLADIGSRIRKLEIADGLATPDPAATQPLEEPSTKLSGEAFDALIRTLSITCSPALVQRIQYALVQLARAQGGDPTARDQAARAVVAAIGAASEELSAGSNKGR